MQVTRFDIQGPVLITQPAFKDSRGAFTEAYNKRVFSDAIGDIDFVQDNISVSNRRGTVRGMNFQRSPHAQAKLFRVLRGAVFDVSLDLRRGSLTYGCHIATRLNAEMGAALFLPKGFAHGFCTIEDNTQVQYKLDEYFHHDLCATIRWCDPALDIAWPVKPEEAVVLERDRNAPLLAELEPF